MTYKEFVKWTDKRVCDGQWGAQHFIKALELHSVMNDIKFFKEKYWKANCEKEAVELVEDVNRIAKYLKRWKND